MSWFAGRARRRRRQIDDDARDRNRERYRRAVAIDDASVEHRYSISCDLGGFGVIGVPWIGTTLENARDSFLNYMTDHEKFHDVDDPAQWNWRCVYVSFHGQLRLLTFKTDWIAGFTVH